jgi:HSP20 family molecular chaperone IbpA
MTMTHQYAIDTNDTNGVEPASTRPSVLPRADIFETAEGFTLLADMPGVDEKSIEVTVKQNVLTIRGENRAAEPEGFRKVYSEFEQADFVRSFQLSGDADASKIKAAVKNGVLRVAVPKAAPAHRKIPVEAMN